MDVTYKTADLKLLLSAVGTICTECILNIGAAETTVRAVDGARICIFDGSVPNVAPSGTVRVGINIEEMLSALSHISNDTVSVIIDKATVQIIGGRVHYKLSTTVLEYIKEPRAAQPTWGEEFYTSGPGLAEGLSAVSDVYTKKDASAGVRIVLYADGSMLIKDKDTAKVVVTYEQKEIQPKVVSEAWAKSPITATLTSVFGMEYLDVIRPFIQRAEKVLVKLGNDMPIAVALKSGVVNMAWVLAPRIEGDDKP